MIMQTRQFNGHRPYIRHRPRHILRIKGLGFPNLKGGHTGDQLFNVKVEIPTKLNSKQKELLEEFAKESGYTKDTEGEGFLDKMKTFFE